MDDDIKELVHTRKITCRGYRRKDGLWQIEASVSDDKGQAVPFRSRPDVAAGERIHHLTLSVVIDDDYTIRDARAATPAAPRPTCTDTAAAHRHPNGPSNCRRAWFGQRGDPAGARRRERDAS